MELTKIRKGVLLTVVDKITRDIIWGPMSSLKKCNNEMQIGEMLPYQISAKSDKWIVGYVEKSIYVVT
jgi:hypothetical protein